MTYKVFPRRILLLATLLSVILSLNGCSVLQESFGQMTSVNNEPTNAESENASTDVSPKPQTDIDELSEQDIAALKERQATLELLSMPNQYITSTKENAPLTKAILIKALEAYENENYALANGLLDEAKKQNGSLNSAGYTLAGDIYSTQVKDDTSDEMSKQAIESYTSAVSLNASNYKAANRLAALLREQGEFEQALSLYNKAIKAYPGYALSYRNRGILYDLYLQNKQAALADYQQYERLLKVQQAYFEYAQALKQEQIQKQANTLQTAEQTMNNEALTKGITQELEVQVPKLSLASLPPEQIREFLSQAQIKQELRRVTGWIRDVGRQVKRELSYLQSTGAQHD